MLELTKTDQAIVKLLMEGPERLWGDPLLARFMHLEANGIVELGSDLEWSLTYGWNLKLMQLQNSQKGQP